MYIDSIILENFRIYKGKHNILFPKKSSKNIFIITGDNGFGKTTFLTSLIWCLYGKQMADVDEKFKREISESYGYKNFAAQNLNISLQKEIEEIEISDDEKRKIKKNGYSINNSKHFHLKNSYTYSVTINFSDIILPSISCENISIIRTYDAFLENEQIQVLIDGKENELTKEVGFEIFINDFILSKDIAKFFFFDSEKIVSLAELKTLDEKRKLSTAYSEVLGIKKYEDLKNNLENLRIKFRRKSSDINDKNKLDKLLKESEEIQKIVELLNNKIINNDNDILIKRQLAENYQEKLIREGNSISISELINLKSLRDELKSKEQNIKNKIKELLDLAPFAIAGEKFINAYNQMLKEKEINRDKISSISYDTNLKDIEKELLKKIHEIELPIKKREAVLNEIITTFHSFSKIDNADVQDFKVLLDFSTQEENEFQTIYENIKYSYNEIFKQLVKDDKNNKIFLSKTIRKIAQAESNDSDLLIKEIRTEKAKVEKQLIELEKENRKISEDIGSYQKTLSIKNKLIAELSKKLSIDDSDRKKDEVAERLIKQLDEFLIRLKNEKKNSLEISIKHELNTLMHKENFISKVLIDIFSDIIDIKLFDIDNKEINKEKLSKGEQQLYATAILRALVEESEIKFPIFIDSPLQKFDKKHSQRIISEFYPNVSKQVVLFPLLEKELSENEYKLLLPHISCSYIIRNNNLSSDFKEVNSTDLFSLIREKYVYSH